MIETFSVYASRSIEAFCEISGERGLYILEDALRNPGMWYILLNIRHYFDKKLFDFHDAKPYCQNFGQNNVFSP